MKTQDNNTEGPKLQKNEGNESNSLNKDQKSTTEKTNKNPDIKSDIKEGNDHTEWKDPDATDPKVSPEKVQDPVAKGSYTPDNSTNKDSGPDKTNENVTALGVTEHHSPVNINDREKHSEEYAGIEEEEEEETREEEDEAAETSPGEDEEDNREEFEDSESDEEDLYEMEEDEETDTNKKKQKGESFKQNLMTTKHGSIQDRRGAIVQHNQRNGTMRK